MSAPSKLLPTVTEPTDADIIAMLIPDSPEVLCLEPEVALGEAPTVVVSPAAELVVVEPVSAVLAAPQTLPDRERFWDMDGFWLTFLALKYAMFAGIVGIIGFYVVYPVVAFLIMVVGMIGGLSTGIGVLALVVGLFWATALLGFWDHKSSRAVAPTPAKAGAVRFGSPIQVVVPRKVTVEPQKAPSRKAAPEPSPALAHSVGRRGAACGADMTGASNARRHDPKCPDCVEATKSVLVSDDGVVTYV